MLQAVTGWFRRRLGYSTSSTTNNNNHSTPEPAAADAAADAVNTEAWKRVWFQLPAQLLQQQVFYVLALSQQQHILQHLIFAATDARWELLKASRQGLLDDAAAAAAGSAQFAGGGASSSTDGPEPKGRLTMLDVVQAGSNPEALYDAVAVGFGQLLGGGRRLPRQ
jgi:hypothetical protein